MEKSTVAKVRFQHEQFKQDVYLKMIEWLYINDVDFADKNEWKDAFLMKMQTLLGLGVRESNHKILVEGDEN